MNFRSLFDISILRIDYLKQIKLAVYFVSKWIGLFYISNKIFNDRLLILCYHGFQIDDECDFKNELFMDPRIFEKRLSLIKENRKNVIDLNTAISNLYLNKLQRNSIVLTIDDGFHSVLSLAAPILKRYQYPSTLYVTSYYVKQQTPVFRLVVQYMFHKTTKSLLHDIQEPWFDFESVNLSNHEEAEVFKERVIEYGENNCNEAERVKICECLSQLLKVNYDNIVSSRKFTLIDPDQLKETSKFGIDVQLHTHRHRLPEENASDASREIRENRDYLSQHLNTEFSHFCYPSGIWSRKHFEVLANEKVRSATTCQPGLNNSETSPFALYRILDNNTMTNIEFEAHLSGFSEILRNLKPSYHATKRKHYQNFNRGLFS